MGVETRGEKPSGRVMEELEKEDKDLLEEWSKRFVIESKMQGFGIPYRESFLQSIKERDLTFRKWKRWIRNYASGRGEREIPVPCTARYQAGLTGVLKRLPCRSILMSVPKR